MSLEIVEEYRSPVGGLGGLQDVGFEALNVRSTNGNTLNGSQLLGNTVEENDLYLSLTPSPRSRRKPILYEAPDFTKRLSAFEEVGAGQSMIFECQFRGFPAPTVKWYKDDVEIREQDRYRVEATADGTLRLLVEAARKCDEGAYKCKVENQEGVASTTGYLSVTDNTDKTLSSQCANGCSKATTERAVSLPPHLRTIIEQKSLEEREATECSRQPPSPLQQFVEKFRKGGNRSWPFQQTNGDSIDDAESSGSDTSVDSQDLLDDDDDEINAVKANNVVHKTGRGSETREDATFTPQELQPNSTRKTLKRKHHRREQVASSNKSATTDSKSGRELLSNSNNNNVDNGNNIIAGRKKLIRHGCIRQQDAEDGISFDANLLVYCCLVTGATLVGSASKVSPLAYVLVLLLISMTSFRFVLKT